MKLLSAVLFLVIPAKAGIQSNIKNLDSRLRGNDDEGLMLIASQLNAL